MAENRMRCMKCTLPLHDDEFDHGICDHCAAELHREKLREEAAENWQKRQYSDDRIYR